VSTAAGIALATGRPTTALMGDLTFLHDASGLVIPTGEPVPTLRIVVADDRGGSIFALLEHGSPERAGTFERVFATPPAWTWRARWLRVRVTGCRTTGARGGSRPALVGHRVVVRTARPRSAGAPTPTAQGAGSCRGSVTCVA
jgi:hypothetical protein